MSFYILVREDRVFGIILFLLYFINRLLFWQISALDLESINVNFYLQVVNVELVFSFCCFFVIDGFCYGGCGFSYVVGA